MGYLTNYTLEIVNGQIDENFINVLNEKTGYEFEDSYGSYDLYDAKWYSYEEDMINISKLYPDVIFELYGEGEENDDIWKSRFLNGETEHVTAELIFPDFEEIKV